MAPIRISAVLPTRAALFAGPPLRISRRSPLSAASIYKNYYSTASSSASSSSSDPLIVVTDLPAPGSGHIRILELNRPAARNAISKALLSALRDQVDDVARQYDESGREVGASAAASQDMGPTRALIVASALDNCFCAGADLKERRTFTPEDTANFLGNLRGTLTALQALPIPTIAAVSSLALGGGLELALSTHMRVLTSNAVVALPETRLGIIPGAGGTYRLPMLIGMARARDLVLTGRRVSAPEAYFLGIADRLVEVIEEPTEEGKEKTEDEKKKSQAALLDTARRGALSEAVRLAEEICEGGPVAIRAALQAVQYPAEVVENKMYERVVATEDRDEALKAFAEKRRPEFKGR